MRLLLDAHISGPEVGERLARAGHDIVALDQQSGLEALPDEQVLAVATSEQRILVTLDVTDFPIILRDWAQADRAHAGIILIYGIANHEFELLLRGIEHLLALRPDQETWRNHPAVLDRSVAEKR